MFVPRKGFPLRSADARCVLCTRRSSSSGAEIGVETGVRASTPEFASGGRDLRVSRLGIPGITPATSWSKHGSTGDLHTRVHCTLGRYCTEAATLSITKPAGSGEAEVERKWT